MRALPEAGRIVSGDHDTHRGDLREDGTVLEDGTVPARCGAGCTSRLWLWVRAERVDGDAG